MKHFNWLFMLYLVGGGGVGVSLVTNFFDSLFLFLFFPYAAVYVLHFVNIFWHGCGIGTLLPLPLYLYNDAMFKILKTNEYEIVFHKQQCLLESLSLCAKLGGKKCMTRPLLFTSTVAVCLLSLSLWYLVLLFEVVEIRFNLQLGFIYNKLR